MNYGQIANHKTSGEHWVMGYVKEQLKLRGVIHPVIFDVGANIGEYTSQLQKAFRPDSVTIKSFEPSPEGFSILSQKNQGSSMVECINCGIGEKEETLELFYDEAASVHASFTPFELHQLGRTNLKKIKVPLVSLDHFCEVNHIDRIHFLKLDIEGHEIFALKGAAKMLEERRIDFIQFEFGVNNIQHRTYLKNMVDLLKGYTIARILRNGIRIFDYNYRNEIIITTNYLAFLDQNT